jgi:hypothetical protein
MAANPVPHNATLIHDAESPIIKPYSHRIDVVLALQLLELQAGM